MADDWFETGGGVASEAESPVSFFLTDMPGWNWGTFTFDGGTGVSVTLDMRSDPISVDTHGATMDQAAEAFWIAIVSMWPAILRKYGS